MSLNAGERLGPYEVLAPIGKGGMGEVYRARDSRLGRDVAIKVLHTGKLADPSHRDRFLREARAASALSHPCVVTIYDIGTEGDRVYMVMELIEGRTLDTVIVPGGLPIPEVILIATQIADAFSQAHTLGIVHRDLKPGNVMLTPPGRVKVLDFGLAKLVEQTTEEGEATRTIAAPTIEGTVMGTAPYMSPEQAEGKPVDARSDIFSFGALLYELCTGERAFRGATPMSVIASVIRDEPAPAWKLREGLPPELARMIERCMRKDPARRAQSMADLKVALEEWKDAAPPAAVTPVAGGKRAPWLLVAAIAAALGIGYFVWRGRGAGSTDEPLAAPVPFTSYQGSEVDPEFSPDGNQAAFAWNGEAGDNWDIYVKLIGPGPPLRLTTDPRRDSYPRWSPDGKRIAFRRLLGGDRVAVIVVPPLGGPERKIGEYFSRSDLAGPILGLAWTPDSRHLIVTAATASGEPNRILLVSVETGTVKTLAELEGADAGYTHPDISPDGTTLAAAGDYGTRKIHLWPLTGSLELGERRTLDTGTARVYSFRWTADSRDIVFALFLNAPVPLYRISAAGGAPRPLTWTAPGVMGVANSAKGNRMIFVRSTRDTNMWEADLQKLERGEVSLNPVAVSSAREVAPDYSWDGKRLAFYSNRGGSVQIWTADADGSRAAQLTSMNPQATSGTPRWSPDGQRIAFDSDSGGSYHIYVTGVEGGQPRALTSGPSSNFIASWSPDGRWVYFTSTRTGRNEIWRVSPEGGEPRQVTRTGGSGARISPDGNWVYYTKDERGLWRMPPEGGPESQITESVYRYNYAVTSKGVYWSPQPPPGGPASVRRLDPGAGVSKEILKIEKPLDLGLAVSPDGARLLFVQRDYHGEDLMLVENFH